MEHRQHLLLIFKEAINNSLKYSGCSEISLQVDLKGKKLTVRLIDDGQGFDTQAEPPGNGLHNMQDRASRMGGTLAIRSSAGRGNRGGVFRVHLLAGHRQRSTGNNGKAARSSDLPPLVPHADSIFIYVNPISSPHERDTNGRTPHPYGWRTSP